MTHWKCLLLCSLLGSASFNALACYTVYDRSNRIVYHAQLPPVDMSLPLHETVPARFPDGHLVFDSSTSCPVSNIEQPPAISARRNPASVPLLTDRGTARTMKVPYEVLPNGAAMIEQDGRRMKPKISVVPAGGV